MIRARYTPGLAFLAAAGDRAALLPATTAGDRLERVWQAMHEGSEAVADAVAGLEQYALFDGDASSVRVVVRGALTARVTGGGIDPVDVAGDDGDEPAERETVVEGAERVSVVLGWAMPKPALPLLGGVVRAASMELVLATAERGDAAAVPAEADLPHETILPVDADGDGVYDELESLGIAQERAEDAEPAEDERQGEDDAPTPEPAEPAGPIVKAPAGAPAPAHPATIPLPTAGLGDHDGDTVLPGDLPSARGAGGDHDGNTVSVAQVQASRPAAPTTPAAEAAERPVARVFVSNGTEVRLDRPVLIGRRPRSVRQVGEDVPHLITVESPMHDISRNHVEIKIEDDAAIATDLHSTNGTMLYRDGDPRRLHPGERTVLIAGDTLDLGEGVVVSFAGLP